MTPYGAVGAFIDITEPNLAEYPLRDRNAILRRLFESDVLGIVVSDISGAFLDVNDHFLNMLGYAREELPVQKAARAEGRPCRRPPVQKAARAGIT